jgi:DNA modification methylase
MSSFTSVHRGNNNTAIAKIVEFYAKPGIIIADVTYGKGNFWQHTDTSLYHFLTSDIRPLKDIALQADFRCLPYNDESIDIAVLDPPYLHSSSGKHRSEARYGNGITTPHLYHNGIIELYRQGIVEAYRVLRNGGQLWVKCKDQIEGERQRWSHIEIYNLAAEIGFYGKDLIIVCPASHVHTRWQKQFHARKIHSYLWIFWKTPGPPERRGYQPIAYR